jgi:glycerophosphoryl diester phosphodiesterase
MRWNTLDGDAPLVIAHRGASGHLPEHTLAAYALGLDLGADVIEPDLVPCAGGELIARHEAELARSTDVLSNPAFTSRLQQGDCLSTELGIEEIAVLKARQPFPGRDTAHDGINPVPSWAQVIEWAGTAVGVRGQRVLLYPELKQPARFLALHIDVVHGFCETLKVQPPGIEVWLQCFEAEPLERAHRLSGVPCTLLLDEHADWRGAIERHGHWLHGLGVDKRLLWSAPGHPSGLVEAAHRAGLRVHPWTFRDDRVGEGFVDVRDELRAVLAQGVDGVFCDFPDTGIEVRRSMQVGGT